MNRVKINEIKDLKKDIVEHNTKILKDLDDIDVILDEMQALIENIDDKST